MTSTAAASRWYTICANKRTYHYIASGNNGIAQSMKTTWYSPELAFA